MYDIGGNIYTMFSSLHEPVVLVTTRDLINDYSKVSRQR